MERTRYKHGQPSWAELRSPDPAASRAFYTELFAWGSRDVTDGDHAHIILTLRDRAVAGIDSAESRDPEWLSYYTVVDVAAAAAAATAAGGVVIEQPVAFGAAGQRAVCSDPAGARFALWQPGARIGAELKSEADTYIAGELSSTDFPISERFYTAVLGWGWAHRNESSYVEATVDGDFVCGVIVEDGFEKWGRPREQDRWLTYFGVREVVGCVERAVDLGASVVYPATENDRDQYYAILRDPHGVPFGLNTR